MDDEAKPYLLTEASGLTGLSVDALRKRIERKKLRGSRSNEDGQWRVWLTSKDVETARSGRLPDRSGQDADSPPDESRTIKAMEGEATALREALGRERERADQAEAAALDARAEAGKAQGELVALAVRVAVAETKAKGLQEALAEARRPFWRRWLGVAALCAVSGLWPAAASAQVDPGSATWAMPGCRAHINPDPRVPRPDYLIGLCFGTVSAIFDSDPEVCLPKGATVGQALRVVARYIDERPARQHENFTGLTIEALRTAWPCRRS